MSIRDIEYGFGAIETIERLPVFLFDYMLCLCWTNVVFFCYLSALLNHVNDEVPSFSRLYACFINSISF